MRVQACAHASVWPLTLPHALTVRGKCVDEVICGYLEELGVSAEHFADVVQKSNGELDAFVVASILTVDDFQQFRAMMIKRNIDLTNEVLKEIEAGRLSAPAAEPSVSSAPVVKEKGEIVPESPEKQPKAAVVAPLAKGKEEAEAAPSTPEKAKAPAPTEAPRTPKQAAEEMDEEKMMEMALKLSQRQFDAEKSLREEQEKALEAMDDGVGADVSVEDKALAAAIRESMKDELEAQREKAEMQQAIALSAAIEEERQKMRSDDGAGGSGSAPLKAPAGGLAPIVDRRTEGAAKAAEIKATLLSRAAEIDRKAEERLAAIAAGAAPSESAAPRLQVSADEVERRKAYLQKQRKALLAKREEARRRQVEEYKAGVTQKENVAPVAPSPKDKYSKTQVGPGFAKADEARAALRRSLAQSLKQELVMKANKA